LKLLAIDTSTEACSAALHVENGLSLRYEFAPRRHAELILPMIDELLSKAQLSIRQLDALAFGRGPGAFTGLRIAAGVIQGLAFSSDLPVVPVSSLAALAQSANGEAENIIAAIDARMGEIYYATYTSGNDDCVELIGEEAISTPQNADLSKVNTCFGVGSGWSTYADELSRLTDGKLIGTDGERYPSAQETVILAVKEYDRGNFVSADKALPVYLRDKVTG